MARTHRRVRPSAKAAFLLNNTENLISALRDIPCDPIDARTITAAIDTINAFQRQMASLSFMTRRAQKCAGKMEAEFKAGRKYWRSFCRRVRRG